MNHALRGRVVKVCVLLLLLSCLSSPSSDDSMTCERHSSSLIIVWNLSCKVSALSDRFFLVVFILPPSRCHGTLDWHMALCRRYGFIIVSRIIILSTKRCRSWRILERTGGQRCNHLPTSISRRAYKPCGWWGDEIACWEFVIWSLWCLTSIILWCPSQTSNHVLNRLPRYAVIIFTGFPFPRTISFIWWLLFTLFDPGTILLWVWTYQHWKFWFNEVCFQAKKIFFCFGP